ncbi:MAG: hypothetical protein HY290_03740, partial [Planctomycetia bacterium]|nr:hypothetical protein [Planctomycetia bacterium]
MRVFLGRYGRRLVAIVLTVGMSTCLAACGSGAGDGAAGAAATREAADPIPVAKAAEAPAESDRPGEDWAEFLGPRQDGTSAETGLLEEWPSAGPPVLWKRQIGEGYSAP